MAEDRSKPEEGTTFCGVCGRDGFSRQLWQTCEIFVYAVAYLCSDSCFIFSAVFQVVNHCIAIERKKRITLKYLISNTSFQSLCFSFFIYDCLISVQNSVTRILCSF